MCQLDSVALACVTSTGLISANAIQALSSWCYTTTWNCCQVPIVQVEDTAIIRESSAVQTKQCSWSLHSAPVEGNGNRNSQVGAWCNVSSGGGRVHRCPTATLVPGQPHCPCEHDSPLLCRTECGLAMPNGCHKDKFPLQ